MSIAPTRSLSRPVPCWSAVVRCKSTTGAGKGTGKVTDGGKEGPQFGHSHAGDDTASSQLMHDIGKGRFQYLGDFTASLNKGPVKLDFGKEAKPRSEKEKEQDELNERNLQLIQRSLLIGSALAAGGCILGWQLTKWFYGVKNVGEFGEVMREKLPKVSGSMEDSAVGRRLKESSEHSREAISESAELTDWRRSLRNKFNTEEGARIARQNSLVLAEKREQEKISRKTRKAVANSVTTVRDEEAGEETLQTAEAKSLEEEGASAADSPSTTDGADTAGATIAKAARSLRRTATQVVSDVEGVVVQRSTEAVSTSVELARSTSKVVGTSVKRLRSFVTQAPDPSSEQPPSTAAVADSAPPSSASSSSS